MKWYKKIYEQITKDSLAFELYAFIIFIILIIIAFGIYSFIK